MPKTMTSAEIRQAFLEFFNEVQHTIVPSAPLPQPDNPTLLFTNAGMNQFADTFLGKEKRAYARAVSSQKCMRVSGKHNDLENVGPSPRHHTFFEMLGNFSFGDYFKEQAIDFAWAFLTQVIGLEPERLWATIYLDDEQAYALWQKYLPAHKIRRFGKKDNFWEMGDVGPCGPCSEIHYYLGDLAHNDGALINVDGDETYLEAWNLVFMQYEKGPDGQLTPLPRPSIDTGMGLERITRIVQGVPSNYETDLFQPALDKVQALLGHSDAERAANYVAYRVIADHGRAAAFLVGDGVIPGNTGGPYVLRMIIRRAARFGRKLGFREPFLDAVAQAYIDNSLGEAYPELRQRAAFIRQTIRQEEERFLRNLESTLTRLEGIFTQLREGGRENVPGDVAFDLYATHGLPLEITRDVAAENGFGVDEDGFRAAQKEHAVASGSGAFGQYAVGANVYAAALEQLISDGNLPREGVVYEPYRAASQQAPIVALFRGGAPGDEASVGEAVELVTAATPFYVEAGGEVSDAGWIETVGGLARIDDTRRLAPGLIVHVGQVTRGVIRVGDSAELRVDDERRADIRRNHTATHLLHRELRAQLGLHVTQQGSLVAPDRLRFDFSHPQAVSQTQLRAIEAAINNAILANYPVQIEFMGQKEAIGAGAMALFGEKYGDIVRTIQIQEADGERYSFELCGGLHVSRTGDIGAFYFTYEGSAAAGIRRVEAVTGRGALAYVRDKVDMLDELADRLNAPIGEALAKLDGLHAENKRLQREVENLRRQALKGQFETLFSQRQSMNGAALLVGRVEGATPDNLRELADWFRDRTPSGVAILATVSEGRPLFVAAVSDDLVKRGLKAGDLVGLMGKLTGGGGGGRPNLAQAGGRDAGKVNEALQAAEAAVRQRLG